VPCPPKEKYFGYLQVKIPDKDPPHPKGDKKLPTNFHSALASFSSTTNGKTLKVSYSIVVIINHDTFFS